MFLLLFFVSGENAKDKKKNAERSIFNQSLTFSKQKIILSHGTIHFLCISFPLNLHIVLFNKNMSNSFYISATRSFLCMICIFVHEAFFCGHYPVKIYIFRQSLNVTSDGCTLGFGGRVSGSLLRPQSDFVCFLKMKINVKDHFSVDPALQRHEDGDAQRLLHRDVTFKSCFRFLWTCSHNFLVTLCTTCFPQGSVLRFHWWGFMSSF